MSKRSRATGSHKRSKALELAQRSTTAEPAGKKSREVFVARPFEGLVDEPIWIALRELVPAATAPLSLAGEYAERYAERPVTLATILPMAAPVIAKPDGTVLLGLQRHQQSGDVSRDLAAALLAAFETAPGDTVSVPALPGPGLRLQDLIASVPLGVTVHPGFEYWLDAEASENPQIRASLERANASIHPTERLAAAPAAFWCRVATRAHLRWVLAEDEDQALNALASLAAEGALTLGEGTKFAGMFRAHGRLIPVWDLPLEPDAKSWEGEAAAFAERYATVLAGDHQLTPAARRARQGLLGRQLTLR